MVQGVHYLFWTLSENIPSWQSMFVLRGNRLCRDIAVVLIASIAIWIPDISLFLS